MRHRPFSAPGPELRDRHGSSSRDRAPFMDRSSVSSGGRPESMSGSNEVKARRPQTAGFPHSRRSVTQIGAHGFRRPASPLREQKAQLLAILRDYEENVRELQYGKGRRMVSDELRSRIKVSVLRSSEALSPTHRSRIKTCGRRTEAHTATRDNVAVGNDGGQTSTSVESSTGSIHAREEDAGDNNQETLVKLQAKKHMLARSGLSSDIFQLDKRIEALRVQVRDERTQREKDLLHRKLAALRVQHQARLSAAMRECGQDRAMLQRGMKEEVDGMVTEHEKDVLGLIEEASVRAADQVSACKCTKEYLCPHNKTAFSHTRKRTKEVLKCQDNARRLRKCYQTDEAKKWEAMAKALDKKHDVEWRRQVVRKVTKSQWGAGKGSDLELLMRKHHVQRQALQQAHKNRVSLLDRASMYKLKTLRHALSAEEHKVRRHAHFAEKKRTAEAMDLAVLQSKQIRALDARMGAGVKVSANIVKGNKTEGNVGEEWTPPTYSGLSNSSNIIRVLAKEGEYGMIPTAIPESERCLNSTGYRPFHPPLARETPQTFKETAAEGERSVPAPRVIPPGPSAMNLPPGHMCDARERTLGPGSPSSARKDKTWPQSQVSLGADVSSRVVSHSQTGVTIAGPSVALPSLSPQLTQVGGFPASWQSPGAPVPSTRAWPESAADWTKPPSPSEGESSRGTAAVAGETRAAASVAYTPCPPARRRSNHKRWRRRSSREQRRSLGFSGDALGSIDGCFEKPGMVTSSGGDTSIGDVHEVANAVSADSLIGLSIASAGGICLRPVVRQEALEGLAQDSPGMNVGASGLPLGSAECRDGGSIHEEEWIKDEIYGDDAKGEAKRRKDEKAVNTHEKQAIILLRAIEGGDTLLGPSIAHVGNPTIQSPAPSSIPSSRPRTPPGASRILSPTGCETQEMKGLFHHQRQEGAEEDAVPIDSEGGSSDTHESREELGNRGSQLANHVESLVGIMERYRGRLGGTGSQEGNAKAEGSAGKSEQSLWPLQMAREGITVSCIEGPSRRYSDLVALGQEAGKDITAFEEPGHSESVANIRGGETGHTAQDLAPEGHRESGHHLTIADFPLDTIHLSCLRRVPSAADETLAVSASSRQPSVMSSPHAAVATGGNYPTGLTERPSSEVVPTNQTAAGDADTYEDSKATEGSPECWWLSHIDKHEIGTPTEGSPDCWWMSHVDERDIGKPTEESPDCWWISHIDK